MAVTKLSIKPMNLIYHNLSEVLAVIAVKGIIHLDQKVKISLSQHFGLLSLYSRSIL